MRSIVRTAALALFAATVALPAAADARPGWHGHHRHKVCRTMWQHHHRVTRCMWR